MKAPPGKATVKFYLEEFNQKLRRGVDFSTGLMEIKPSQGMNTLGILLSQETYEHMPSAWYVKMIL